MAEPDDFAGGVDDEGGGNAALAEGGHVAIDDLARGVNRHVVGHLVALVGHERFYGGNVLIRDADEHHAIGVLLRQLGQMGNALAARLAPRRPELHDIHLARRDRHGRALDPGQSGQRVGGVPKLGRNRGHHRRGGLRSHVRGRLRRRYRGSRGSLLLVLVRLCAVVLLAATCQNRQRQ